MTARKILPDSPDSTGPANSMPSQFRNSIPSPQFPAEPGRYVLYVNSCCPWAHRAVIVLGLKGLQHIIQMVEADSRDSNNGWFFSGKRGPDRDPVTGVKFVKELYLKSDPSYNGRITIPILWDKTNKTIVNNESSQIIRILFEAFDAFLPPESTEAYKGAASFIPNHLRHEIDTLNTWVYDTVNNGVYKVGFAGSQSAYDQQVVTLFRSLDRLEAHLSENDHYPYLFGPNITEADIRLYTTLIRFDVVYYPLFKCNLKMIRYDYPHLHDWLRRLYWSEGPETAGGVFRQTTHFDVIKSGYTTVAAGNSIVPVGPLPSILPF